MASFGQEVSLLEKGSELRGWLKEFHLLVDTYLPSDSLFHSFSSCSVLLSPSPHLNKIIMINYFKSLGNEFLLKSGLILCKKQIKTCKS